MTLKLASHRLLKTFCIYCLREPSTQLFNYTTAAWNLYDRGRQVAEIVNPSSVNKENKNSFEDSTGSRMIRYIVRFYCRSHTPLLQGVYILQLISMHGRDVVE